MAISPSSVSALCACHPQELLLLNPPGAETRLAEVLATGCGKGRRGPLCKELHSPATKSTLVHPDIAASSFYKLLKLRCRILNRSLESLIAIPAPVAAGPTSACFTF